MPSSRSGDGAPHLGWLVARPIAHRGLHGPGTPENTMAAFRAAIGAGYAIECDLHPSADGVPVVFHDDALERLTGERGFLRDRTAADLGRLRVGGADEAIPTLRALLEEVGERVPLVLELKSVRGRDRGFAAAVAEALRAYCGPVAVMSFEPRLMAECRRRAPGLARGLTAEGDWRRGALHLAAVLAFRLHFVSYSIRDLPTWAPLFARRTLRLPLICWTVRTAAEREKAARYTDQITFEGFRP
jgi:glycerophosphoryl diester phosphodiesterase